NLGCYRALGFTKGQITSIYIAITSVISLAFLLLGLVVGYCYSYILLDTYQVSYNVNNVVRGLSVSSFATGIMVPTVLLCIMTYLASGVYRRVEISKLFTEQGKSNKNLRTMRLFEKVAKILPSKYSFSSKLALRKPFNVFLILVSVYIYLVLIVISISLNMSSSKVYQSQTAFRHYKYEVTFSNAKVDSDSKEKGDQYFLEKKIKLASDNKNIGQQNLVAMDNDGDYFHLVNKRQKIQLSNGEVAINPRIAEIYNIKSGDKVLIKYKNFEKYLIVKAIADNGNTSSIYIKRTYFNKLIGNPANTYNGLW
ncbi:ABC transporter permease, partial [Streptococcus mutans]|nr:ABC transporter permease [Streptococcus mutans]